MRLSTALRGREIELGRGLLVLYPNPDLYFKRTERYERYVDRYHHLQSQVNHYASVCLSVVQRRGEKNDLCYATYHTCR